MRRAKNTVPENPYLNKDFFEAVKMLEETKGISSEYLFEKINAAIISATRNTYQNRDIVVCEIKPEEQTMRVYVRKNVVEEIEDEITDLTLEEARAYDENAVVGGTVEIPLETKNFGRIVAQTAKSVIRQGIREAERELMNKEFASRKHELVTAKVISVYLDTGDARIEIGRAEATLPKSEQLPNDDLKADQSQNRENAPQEWNFGVFQRERGDIGHKNGDDQFRGLQFPQLTLSHQPDRKNHHNIDDQRSYQ